MSLGSLEWGRTSPTGGRALRFSGLVIDMPLLVLLLATASVARSSISSGSTQARKPAN